MPVTRRGRLRFEQTETDSPDDGGGGDEDTNGADEPQPSTSLADLTTEADPQQFDQTFTAGDADLTIQGRFDPVAGSRQVIPRVAYVLNYNLVYNESRDRWEPKKKDRFQVRAFRTNTQTIAANSSEAITFQATSGRDSDRVSTPTSGIQVPRDGQYVIAASVIFDNVPDSGGINCFVNIDGVRTAEGANAAPDNTGDLNGGSVTVADLTAGATLEIRIGNNTGSSIDIVGDSHTSTLAVGQL
jgi:hypothetical protein